MSLASFSFSLSTSRSPHVRSSVFLGKKLGCIVLSDPRSNPPNSVILCERIKDVGNFKAKSGSWRLISYDFGAEDPFPQFLSQSPLLSRSPLHRQQISTAAALQTHLDGKPKKKSWSSTSVDNRTATSS